MRENRLSGSEGGGVANPTLPTPIQGSPAASKKTIDDSSLTSRQLFQLI